MTVNTATTPMLTMHRSKLYPHQEEALRRLRVGSILCGGVGSGKSRTALAFWEKCGKPDLYIITTPKKRDSKDWEREALYFDCAAYDKPFCFVVDSWPNIQRYVKVRDAFFIFDEHRAIGKGVWAKAFITIAKRNRWVLLTATPGDDWMDWVPVFIAKGYFRNRTEFYRNHCVFSRLAKYPKIERYIDIDILEEYRKRTLVMMDYKKETKRILIPTHVAYPKAAYDRASKYLWNVFENKPIENMSEKFFTLRRVSIMEPSRIVSLKEIFNCHKKLIIFYNFDYELWLLAFFAKVEGLAYAQWNGHKHEPIPETDSWLYLVQYTAGAEAWECTETDTIVFFSLSYSYKTMVQAAGRIDRMNTPFDELFYYIFVSDSPIERQAVRALKNKENFNLRMFQDTELDDSQKKHRL